MKRLLVIDGLINLALGALLIAFPEGLARRLGLPPAEPRFYAHILGAVLFGIGLALFIEIWRPRPALGGLGLGGAISINLCGGLMLAAWLLFGDLQLTAFGGVFLWGLVIVLVGISLVEGLAVVRKG